MSSIAKAFIAINAALALAFLGFASALVYRSGDYKTKYEEEKTAHDKTTADMKKAVDDQKAINNNLQKEYDTVRQEKGRAQTDADSYRNAYDQEKTVNAQLRGAVDEIKANLGNFNNTIGDLHNQIAALHTEKDKIRDAKDAAVTAQEKAEAERSEAVALMTKFKEELASLQDGATQAKKERDALDAKLKALIARTGVALDNLQAQPQIDGTVVEVDPTYNQVAFNVGKADGVQAGFAFDIYRDKTYKGKAVIDNVQDKFCSGKIQMKAPGTTIEKGDRATTRL